MVGLRLVGFAILWQVTAGTAAPAQSLNLEALHEIDAFAESFCGKFLTEGNTNSVEVTGQAEADLKGLLNKLADLGVSGTATINTESYAGVLREDVRGTMQDSRECKLMIWNDLKATVAQQAVAPVLQPESAPHAPPIEINQRFQMWEEQTMQFVLEPGDARDLEGMELYTTPATYPRSSCAGPGFVPYTWQIRDPYPGGGDLEIRQHLMGGTTEQVGLGSMGRATLGFCGIHTFKNNGVQPILVEVRHASAADTN